MAVVCVDVLLTRNDGREFLLMKRINTTDKVKIILANIKNNKFYDKL